MNSHFPKMAADDLDFQRAALFLDVDGTLLDIAATPDRVVVPDGLVETIARLERLLGGALAIVTGRTLADLDRLFFPLRTRAAGVHGAEMRFDPNAAAVETPGAAPLPDSLWREFAAVDARLSRRAGREQALFLHRALSRCAAGGRAAARGAAEPARASRDGRSRVDRRAVRL